MWTLVLGALAVDDAFVDLLDGDPFITSDHDDLKKRDTVVGALSTSWLTSYP